MRSFDLPRINTACASYLAAYRQLDRHTSATVIGPEVGELFAALQPLEGPPMSWISGPCHPEPAGRTSSRCYGGECVRVDPLDDGVVVSSTARPGRVFFTDAEWQAFVDGVRDGEFDLDRLRGEL